MMLTFSGRAVIRALLLILLLGSLSPLAAAPLKVGVAGAHSGDLAPYGLPTLDAARMAVAAQNAAGGVLGAPVELVTLDDQCKPEIATNVATRLVSEKVDVVIGHICSGATKAALGIYQEAGILVISPSATETELTRSGKSPNFFRTIAPDDTQGKLAATFVTSTLKAKKVAVIHDKGAYGKGFADFAAAAIEAIPGAKVVLYEGITPGAINYSAVVQKLRREGAEAVIFGGYHPEASKLVAQMLKKRVDIPFIGPDGIKGNGFLDIAGKNAEGVYATGPRDVSRQPLNKQAHDAYRQQFGKEPGTFFDQGYAALQAVFNAANLAGSTDLVAMSKVLREKPVETTLGTIHFDPLGDAVGVGFSVYQVRNGSFVELTGK